MSVTYTSEGPAVPRCPQCRETVRVSVVAPPKHDPNARYLCARCSLVFTGSAEEAAAQVRWEARQRAESPGWKSKAEKVAEARQALEGKQ
jgi:transposase-like protein